MVSYSFWNNKGGVGKSFLCFVAASEYAHRHQDADVYIIDLCPQANVSEILFGGYETSPKALRDQANKEPRATVAGYLESRLSSPFRMVNDIHQFICKPHGINSNIPENLFLVCGDNLLEVISEAIRQTSQLAVPVDAWKQVLNWIKDLTDALRKKSGERESIFFIDCNPSFAIYTQLALVASNHVVVPFTPDDSSRRAILNVIALLYGIRLFGTEIYAKISFSKRAEDESINLPKLHSFINNRVTVYGSKTSKAFQTVSKAIKNTINDIHKKHKHLFSNPRLKPSDYFLEVPDYHSACIISSMTGTPLHRLKPGPHDLIGTRVQINQDPLNRYRDALSEFVDCL